MGRQNSHSYWQGIQQWDVTSKQGNLYCCLPSKLRGGDKEGGPWQQSRVMYQKLQPKQVRETDNPLVKIKTLAGAQMTASVKLVQASETLTKHREQHLPVVQLFHNGFSCWQSTLSLTILRKRYLSCRTRPSHQPVTQWWHRCQTYI